MNVMHELDLYRVGGVEQLFFRYLMKSQSFKQHLLLHSSKPHSFFQKSLKNYLASVSHAKKIVGLRLPKPLRGFNIARILRQKKTETLVCWNCVSNLKKGPKNRIYYEHGLANCFKNKDFSNYLNSFDRIISCSEASKRVLELKWKVRADHVVVSNPLFPQSVSDKAAPRDLNIKRPFRMGVVARLVSIKAHALSLHCLKSLLRMGLNVELIFAGDGELKDSLKALAKTLQIEQHVQFLSNVSDIASFYQSIDLLLSFSVQESYGLSVIEAMANGCPVLSSLLACPVLSGKAGRQKTLQDISRACLIMEADLPISELLDLGGVIDSRTPSFVYDPKKDKIVEAGVIDPEKAAKKIAHLLEHPELYQKMSANAFLYARENFSFSKYMRELEAAISL